MSISAWLRGLISSALVWGLFSGAVAASAREISSDGRLLLQQLLETADYDSEFDRNEAAARIEGEMAELLDRFDSGQTTLKKARRLHRVLHREWLVEYDPDADHLEVAIEEGRFNCLSGTLLYALAARELGYDVIVVETPGHLFLELETPARSVVVESTSSYGFDVPLHRIAGPDAKEDASRWLRLEAPGTRPSSAHPGLWRMSLEEAVGFAWLNRAWILLEAGEAAGSARAVDRALGYLPTFAPRSKGVDRLLTRAFHQAYERGAFEEAYLSSRIALVLYPESTSVRDRLYASAAKGLIQAAEQGRLTFVEERLTEVREALAAIDPIGLRGFERSLLPDVIAAAVRESQFLRARRWQLRHAEVERDPIEVRRLNNWLEARTRDWIFPLF